MMVVSNFPKIIQTLLKDLPKNDYPVLNTFLFVSCWLGWVMDKSLVSMRDLSLRLNSRGIYVHISTFSKASKHRSVEVFENILIAATKLVKNQAKKSNKHLLFPIDSTIITLTSKLLWCLGYQQVKLFCGLNSWTSELGGIVIHFGQGHDSKYGQSTIEQIPENAVGVMDRGFSSLSRIKYLLSQEKRYFVLRIKNNLNLINLPNGNCLVGTGLGQIEVRVVNFCDLENHSEYRLATNLPEAEVSEAEVGEIYRNRWAIESLWKFLKMHLKLDKMMTKNENGIRIQIYSCLIVYLILQVVTIPPEIGHKCLDKLRYLQAFMTENISYIHWFKRLSFSW